MQQGPFYPQNQQQPQPQKNRPIISGGTIIKIILKLLLGGRTYNLFIFCRAKTVILTPHGRGAEEVFRHINNLFRVTTHSSNYS